MCPQDYFGIEVVSPNTNCFIAETRVTNSLTRSPGGILHGGVSALIAEDVAGKAGQLFAGVERTNIVGINVESSHLLSVLEGDVIRTVATPAHLGSHIQVWDIEQFRLSDGKKFNVSRVTNYVLNTDR